MEKALENITETIKENWKDLTEIIKERVFSPMYFYFFIAWIITNWKFVYSFLFLDPEFIFKNYNIDKINYLVNFYKISSLFDFWWSFCQLFLIPAVSSFVFVWWLSKVSENFYEKTEEHKQNKRVINKWIEFQEEKKIKLKLHYINEKFEKDKEEVSKDIQSNKILYNDNNEFNQWFDNNDDEKVIIWELEFYKSDVLYNTDYESYKIALNEWKTEKKWKIKNFLNSWNFKNTHNAVEELNSYIWYFTEDEIKEILLWFTKNSQIISDEDVKNFISEIYDKENIKLDKKEIEKIEKFLQS